MVVHNPDPINAEPPASALAEHELTPSDAFYCRNHGAIPDIAGEQWRLEIGGMVANPLTLDYERLTTEFTAHRVASTLACAGNRRAEMLRIRPIPGKEPWERAAISTAVWRGARLSDVLRAAGVDPEDALHVAFTAPDVAYETSPAESYGSSIPLAKAMSDEVLLAWEMNGTPLPRLHGGPVRVVVPGYIGARSVKWINGITVQPGPSQNYFQAVEYRLLPPDGTPARGAGTPLSTLDLNCAMLTPEDGSTIRPGPVQIGGYAIAEHCDRIARVEISLDHGVSWQQAELPPADNRWAWRLWSLTVEAQPGPLSVTARAWDDTGATQPESPAALWNPCGYANNAWARAELTVS
ncbi:MAG TPA: sulfite oxidase [Mycobacterium sp.]|nr:sulfite oxidase [Mycobacterium sp.]